MSTLKTTSITHGSNSGTANLTLASDGKVTIPEKKLYCPGTIIQVQQTVKTDVFSNTNTNSTFTDVTGLTITITPNSNSNKILVSAMINAGHSGTGTGVGYRLVRTKQGGSDEYPFIADASSSRYRYTWGLMTHYSNASNSQDNLFGEFLDNPFNGSGTVVAVTYKIQQTNSGGTAYVNRSGEDLDGTGGHGRSLSTITVKEVAG